VKEFIGPAAGADVPNSKSAPQDREIPGAPSVVFAFVRLAPFEDVTRFIKNLAISKPP